MRCALLALVLLAPAGGCFSGDDFADCVEPGQCGLGADGRALMCVSGLCESAPIPDESEAVVLSGELGDLHPHPGRVVIIEDVEVAQNNFRVEAEVIIVRGPIRGTGAGLAGGLGGGGGPVGSPAEAGEQGQPARDAVASGGPAGLAGGADEDGAPGGGGTYPTDEPCRIDFDFAQPGSGGGGGGGGGGGLGAGGCRGSRGGVGGAGGGAIMLKASRFIEVQGAVEAAGESGLMPEAPVCGTAGEGALGGGGSGGLIYMHAPTILFGEGARLDVQGAGEGGGGLVTLFGAIEGRFPGVEGASGQRICRR